MLGVWWVVAWAITTHDIRMEESGDIGIVSIDHSAIANINIAISVLFQVVVVWTIDWLSIFRETENSSVWFDIPSVSNGGKDISRLDLYTSGVVVPCWVN